MVTRLNKSPHSLNALLLNKFPAALEHRTQNSGISQLIIQMEIIKQSSDECIICKSMQIIKYLYYAILASCDEQISGKIIYTCIYFWGVVLCYMTKMVISLFDLIFSIFRHNSLLTRLFIWLTNLCQ